MNDSRAVLSKWMPKNHNGLFYWCLVKIASTFGALPGGFGPNPTENPSRLPFTKGER
jgi:hypothetical protein